MIQTTTLRKIIYALAITSAIFIGGGYYISTHYYGITPYSPKDQAALTSLLRDDWYWLVSEDSTDFTTEYMFEHYAATPSYPDKSLHIFVYRLQGKPVGLVTYYRESGSRGKVQFVAVHKDYRKRGYAEKLLRFALAEIAAHGMYTAELVTRTNNISAQRLYKKLGFKQTWQAEGFVGFEKSLLGM